MTPSTVSRRAALAGACAGCVGLVAACASGSSGQSSSSSGSSSSGSSGGGSGAGTSSAGKVRAGKDSAGKNLVALKDVPVGGGVVVNGPSGQVVVAQPSSGQVVAFSAVCTHMGGIVQVEGQQLVCPLHGSRYSLADGSVEQGPAPKPLPKVAVRVSGTEVVTA